MSTVAVAVPCGGRVDRTAADAGRVRWGSDGLVPVVVQDVADGRVLMLAYANAEALAATLATGEVHFYSRSRRPPLAQGRDERQRPPPRRPRPRLRRRRAPGHGRAGRAGVPPWHPELLRRGRSARRGRPDRAAGPVRGPPRVSTGSSGSGRRSPTGSRAVRPGPTRRGSLAAGVDGAGRKVVEEATEVLMAAKDDAVAEAAGRRPDGRSATRSPARSPTCSTTPWSCSPSEASRRRP